MIILQSKRLNFYKLSQNTFEELCQMELDPEVMKYYTSRPTGKREYAVNSFNRYMEYMDLHPKLGAFMAFTKDSEEFVGLGVLMHLALDPNENRYEVGYRLPTKNWGKGFATEIANALLNYGFETLGLTEIYGTTNPENSISERVLTKCGLKKIGTTPEYGGSNLFKITKS